jgi:membrane fusion protein (multidrug efflux system)
MNHAANFPAASDWLLSPALIAAALSVALGGCAKPLAPAVGPVAVEVATVKEQDLPVTEQWVATVYGFVDAQVRAQVTGNLIRQDYAEGEPVRQGDLLFEIDPRPFQAALDQAKAQLAQAEAQVQADLAAKAQVASAKATVEKAQLDLEFTRITSPVDGIAGLIQAEVGDLVGPGTGILTTVSTLDPMKVYFPISEASYLEIMEAHPKATGFPTRLAPELVLSDGSVYPKTGKFYAADSQIDPNTGTLRIAALFPNPRHLLRPGQYARVRAVVRTIKGALLVPERALTELQGGYQVATVDGSNRAHVQMVKVGPRVGGMAVIEEGLKPDERVIVDGFTKVREGTPVNPQS